MKFNGSRGSYRRAVPQDATPLLCLHSSSRFLRVREITPIFRSKLLTGLALCLALSTAVRAQTNIYIDGNGKWEASNNWARSLAPSTNDIVDVITNAGNNTVTIDATTTNSPSTMTVNNLIVATNTLQLTNAGLFAPLTVLGFLTLSNNASMLITNSALQVNIFVFIRASKLTVLNGLYTGLSNQVIAGNSIANLTFSGGTATLGSLDVGGGGAGTGEVWITGGCTLKINDGPLQVGTGAFGQLIISNATVSATTIRVPKSVTTPNSSFIALNGGLLSVSNNLEIGTSSGGIGLVEVQAGTLAVTNAGMTARLDVNAGTLSLNGGTLIADNLVVSNNGQFVNMAGVFTVKGQSQVNNGSLALSSGTNTLAGSLAVGNLANATGMVNVASGSTLVATNSVLGFGNDGSGSPSNGLGFGQATVSGTMLANIIQLGSTAGGHGDLMILTNGVVDFSFGAAGSNTLLACNDLVIVGGYLNMPNGTIECGLGKPGAMTMAAGTATCFIMEVAADNPGTMTMSGGIMTMMPNSLLNIGGSLSAGSTWMSGGQILQSGAFTISLGNNNIGKLAISNGSIQATTVAVGNTGTSPPASPAGTLTVAGGSLTIDSNLYVGAMFQSTGTVSVTSGQLLINTGTITIGGMSKAMGQFTIANGLVQAQYLIISNGAVFALSGGTLSCGDAMTVGAGATMASNDLLFVVGNGTSTATFNLLGINYHTFSKGLEVNTNSYLVGCGTINGNILVDKGGTVVANCGGTLTFNGIVTNNGTMRALNGSTLKATGAVVNSGVINIIDGQTNFPGGFMNINNGIVVDGSFRITAITRENSDIRVFWTIVSNRNYVVQVTSGSGAEGDFSNNFTDLSSTISIPANPVTSTTNYLDIGGGTNQPSRYYRVRLGP